MRGKLPLLVAMLLTATTACRSIPQRQTAVPQEISQDPEPDFGKVLEPYRRIANPFKDVNLSDFTISEQRTYTDRDWPFVNRPFVNPQSGQYQIRTNPDTGDKLLLDAYSFPIAVIRPAGDEWIAERSSNDMIERTRYRVIGEEIETVYRETIFNNGNAQRFFGPLRRGMRHTGYPMYRIEDGKLVQDVSQQEFRVSRSSAKTPYFGVSYEQTEEGKTVEVGQYVLGQPTPHGRYFAWAQRPIGETALQPDIPKSALSRALTDDFDRRRLEDFCAVVPIALQTVPAQDLCRQLQ